MNGFTMPAPDFVRSPITGWTRDHWIAFADQQLLAARDHFSPTGALINLPGRPSWSGPSSDGMEGFARTFLLAAFRVAGEQGHDPHGHLPYYQRGLVQATTPGSPEAWLPITDRSQAMVEAASVVIALELTKPWLWETLSPNERDGIANWLQGSSTSECVDNNWVLFQVMIAEFLASAGYEHNEKQISSGLSRLEDWYAGGGWYRDGDNSGSGDFFDYYCGWAMHLYPLLWSDLASGRHPDAKRLGRTYAARLNAFLDDHALFFGGNGSPVFQGRSLIYRYAAVAPLFMGTARDCSPLSPGQTRRIASGAAKFFLERGAYQRGIPTLGWLGDFEPMVQSYSGPASPYWSSKAFVGLLLPGTHPLWTAVEEESPVERDDQLKSSTGPNYLLHSTAGDGVARVLNHGSDKYYGLGSDAPEYRRLAYSSHTAPLYTADPVDNHFAVLSATGVPSRRARIHRVPAGRGQAASFHRPVWTDTDKETESAWRVTTATTAAEGFELRVHVVQHPAGLQGETAVREGGYALASDQTFPRQIPAARSGLVLANEDLYTAIWPLCGYTGSARSDASGASPLGTNSSCGYLTGTTSRGQNLHASLVYLGTREPRLLPGFFEVGYDGKRISAHLVLTDDSPRPRNLTLRLGIDV